MKRLGIFFLLFLASTTFAQVDDQKIFVISASQENGLLSPPPAVFAPKEYYSFNPQLPKVNVITGEYCEEECDLIVAGIEPLSYRRFYGHRGHKDECFGHWRINPEALFLFNFEIKKYPKYGGVGYENGGFSLYEKGNKDAYWFDSTKNFSFTNAEAVTGQNHPLNTRIVYKKADRSRHNAFQWEGVIEEGSGRQRFFKSEKKKWANGDAFPPYQAKICSERRPNGNVIVYDYENYNEDTDPQDYFILNSITAYSAQGVFLGSLKISYQKGKGDWVSNIHVTGSDKRDAHLNHELRKVKEAKKKRKFTGDGWIVFTDPALYDVVLGSVNTCWKPTQNYQYKWEKAKKYFDNRFLYQAGQGEGRILETHYNSKKVGVQTAPVGLDDQMVPIAQYIYNRYHTIVLDGENNKTVFHYNRYARITAIERYLGDQLYSIEKSDWEPRTGNLLNKKIEDSSGNLLIFAEFLYDEKQNLKEEKIEQDKTTRTFTDDSFNLIKTESDRLGKVIEYGYIPNTNLLKTEFIKDHGNICKRTFHFYDDQIGSACIRTIIDDGTSEDPEDLSKITYRRILEILPKRTEHCIGLPEQITEKTLDSNGTEIQLRRVVYTYHPSGKILHEDYYDANDQFSHSLTNIYDAKERLKAKTDALGNKIEFKYDDNFNLIQQTGPRTDMKTEWVYDKANRPIAEKVWQTDGSVLVSQKKYDKASRLIASVDVSGFETRYSYDSLGRLMTKCHPDGALERKEYDVLGNVTKETDANDYSIRKEYNFRGQPIAIYHPNGSEEHFVYNDNGGTLASHIDTQGTKTHYTYDIFDRPILTETSSLSGDLLKTISATYSSFNKLSETDGEGKTTYYQYDYAGRKIAETCNGKETLYFYDALGRQHKTQQGDAIYEEVYDLKDQPLEKNTRDLSGNLLEQEKYIYDEAGNCTHFINSKGVTETVYNTIGLPIQKKDALGNVTQFSYSYANGFIQIETDPLGVQTHHLYDSRKNEIETSKKNAAGQTIQKVQRYFDPNQNLVQEAQFVFEGITPLKTIVHSWIYGPGNRLEKLIEAGQKETSYLYDSTGKLATLIKPDKNRLNSEYDPISRLAHYFSSDFDYIYTYDKNDNVLSIFDAVKQEKTTRAYDPFGNITREVLANGLTLSYAYDGHGRRVLSIFPDNTLAQYVYQVNRLYQIRRNGLKYTYTKRDMEGHPTRIDLPSQMGRIDLERDPLSRWKLFASPFYTSAFSTDSYDAVGNLCHYRYSDSLGPKRCSYTYDDLRQLTSENEHHYTHDSLHNRLAKNDSHYTINDLCAITHDGAQSYEYDLNGNLLSDGKSRFGYDSLDRLTSVQQGSEQILYAYDPFNRRLSKTLSGKKTLYFYDGDNEIGSTDENGSIQELRILGEGLGAEIGASVFFEIQGKTYFPIHDHRGCIVTLMNPETRKPAETYRYTAFGEELASGTLSPWRFSSKRVDPETGFVYFGRRYYSTALGRWITPDPQGFADGPNLYAYVKNSPLLYFDLYGLNRMDAIRGGARGGLDFCCEGIYNTGLWMEHRIRSNLEMGWNMLTDPVAHVNGLWNTAKDFACEIPNQMNLDSLKTGVSDTAQSLAPKTAKALANRDCQDSYTKGYERTQAALETATLFLAARCAVGSLGTARRGAKIAKKAAGVAEEAKAINLGQNTSTEFSFLLSTESITNLTPEKFFGTKTYAETQKLLTGKFGQPRGEGLFNKSFFNPKTGRTFNLHWDPTHREGKPHIDIRKRGLSTDYYKNKPFFLKEE